MNTPPPPPVRHAYRRPTLLECLLGRHRQVRNAHRDGTLASTPRERLLDQWSQERREAFFAAREGIKK
jgi:hypothetical protein